MVTHRHTHVTLVETSWSLPYFKWQWYDFYCHVTERVIRDYRGGDFTQASGVILFSHRGRRELYIGLHFHIICLLPSASIRMSNKCLPRKKSSMQVPSSPTSISQELILLVATERRSWEHHRCVFKELVSILQKDWLTSLYRLDERQDGGELQNYLQEKTGQRSLPNIFISA